MMLEQPALSRMRAAPRAAPGGRRFDWIMIALSTWLLVGAYLDSWAHNHLADLESFFTPWHGVLYAGYLTAAGFLLASLYRNHRRGYTWARALPAGYNTSLVGAGLFLLGGVGDGVWHTLFGVERDFAVVLSPTHLILTLGAILMASGPLRAAWLRPAAADDQGWPALGAMVFSAALCLCGLTYLTGYANPFQNRFCYATLSAQGRPEERACRSQANRMRPPGHAGSPLETKLREAGIVQCTRRQKR